MIPEFDVFNLEESLNFYVDLLGFKVVYDRQEDKFAFLQLEKIQLMIQEINVENNKWKTGKLEYPLGRGINFQIDVTNIDEIYNKLKEKNINKYFGFTSFQKKEWTLILNDIIQIYPQLELI